MSRLILLTFAATLLIGSLAIAQPHHDAWFGTWSGIQEVDGNCFVPSGQTLRFLAGTQIRFLGPDPYEILVQPGATLQADGTEQSPVLFTANVGTQPGSWKALIAQGSSGNYATMNLTNCEIRYAGEHEIEELTTSGPVRAYLFSSVTVNQCFIHDNWGDGAGTYHVGAPYNHLVVTDTRIEGCEIGVKIVSPDRSSEVIRNYISSCALGIYQHGVDGPITNNIIENSTSCGARGDFVNFRNNVIIGTHGNGIEVQHEAAANAIVNNILKDNTGWGIYSPGEPNPVYVTVSYNCYSGNGNNYNRPYVTSLNHLFADPLFVGNGFGDDNYYHLRWNSPCLGEGWDQLPNSNPTTI